MEKYLCWSLFLINLQAYKPATLSQRDSNTGVNITIFLKNFILKDICERPFLNFIDTKWENCRKTDTYPETIIGRVFRTQ